MLIVALPPVHGLLGETAWPLLLVAPMIAGQALLDLFLAATRWKHRMRYEVVGRSIVEPYAATAATVAAYFAGFTETGLLIGYWAGTLLALAYAVERRCAAASAGFGLRRYRLPRACVRALLRESAVPTLSDFTSALFGRLDLYLVGLFLGESPAGIYGVARQVRTPIRQVRQSFDGLLTPIVARTLAAAGPARTGEAIASASRLILAIQLAILVDPGRDRPALARLVRAGIRRRLLGASRCSPRPRRSRARSGSATSSSSIASPGGASDHRGRPPSSTSPPDSPSSPGSASTAPLCPCSRRWSPERSFAAGRCARVSSIKIPLRYSAGPVLAAMLAVLAALAAKSLPAAAPIRDGVALAAALLVYAAALKLWLAATGDSLALVKFRTD